MGRHCETFEHTADVGLRATADTLSGLMEALAEGLADLICPRANVRAAETRELSVRAEDREALCVDFLWEVMSAIQADRFALAAVRVTEASETSVTAELSGESLDPDRHEIAAEVKAVTYHKLSVEPTDDGWAGQVILDL